MWRIPLGSGGNEIEPKNRTKVLHLNGDDSRLAVEKLPKFYVKYLLTLPKHIFS